MSKQPGNQRLKVRFNGIDNEDKVPCPKALQLPPPDSNRNVPHDKEFLVLSTEPQELPNYNLIDIGLLMDEYKWVNWILVLLNEWVLFARSFIEYFLRIEDVYDVRFRLIYLQHSNRYPAVLLIGGLGRGT